MSEPDSAALGPRVIKLTESPIQARDHIPELLTIDELQELLRLPSRGATYVAAKRGRIPTVNISARCIRFPRAGVAAWLAARTKTGAGQ